MEIFTKIKKDDIIGKALLEEIRAFVNKWGWEESEEWVLISLVTNDYDEEWLSKEDESFAFFVDSENLKETFKQVLRKTKTAPEDWEDYAMSMLIIRGRI